MAHPLVNDNAMKLEVESLLSAYIDGQSIPISTRRSSRPCRLIPARGAGADAHGRARSGRWIEPRRLGRHHVRRPGTDPAQTRTPAANAGDDSLACQPTSFTASGRLGGNRRLHANCVHARSERLSSTAASRFPKAERSDLQVGTQQPTATESRSNPTLARSRFDHNSVLISSIFPFRRRTARRGQGWRHPGHHRKRRNQRRRRSSRSGARA